MNNVAIRASFDFSNKLYKRQVSNVSPPDDEMVIQQVTEQTVKVMKMNVKHFQNVDIQKIVFNVRQVDSTFRIVSFTLTTEDKIIEHKMDTFGNNYSTKPFLTKVGAIFMPHGMPTAYQLYSQEMTETYTENFSIKIFLSGIFTFISVWLGVDIINLIGAFLCIAFADVFLSLIPGNVKKRNKKNHTIQAKAWALLTNIIAIIVALKAHESLSSYEATVPVFNLVLNYFHYGILGLILFSYAQRMLGYIANANKVQIPNFMNFLTQIPDYFKTKK
jgi:hypothetical protein